MGQGQGGCSLLIRNRFCVLKAAVSSCGNGPSVDSLAHCRGEGCEGSAGHSDVEDSRNKTVLAKKSLSHFLILHFQCPLGIPSCSPLELRLSPLIPSAGGQWDPGSPAQWEQPCMSILGTELMEVTLLCQPSPGCGTWALPGGAGGSSSLSLPVLTAWSCAGVLSTGVAPQSQPGSRCCPGHRHSWTQQRLYLP